MKLTCHLDLSWRKLTAEAGTGSHQAESRRSHTAHSMLQLLGNGEQQREQSLLNFSNPPRIPQGWSPTLAQLPALVLRLEAFPSLEVVGEAPPLLIREGESNITAFDSSPLRSPCFPVLTTHLHSTSSHPPPSLSHGECARGHL